MHVATAERGEWTMRDGPVFHIGDARVQQRRAAFIDRQPGDLHADGHTVGRDDDADASVGDLNVSEVTAVSKFQRVERRK